MKSNFTYLKDEGFTAEVGIISKEIKKNFQRVRKIVDEDWE